MTPDKKTSRSEQKHNDIIAAAVLEFQETGFAGARIDDIAARAKVSKRTLYKHFGSKQALFQAIVELVLAGFDNTGIAPYQPDTPIEDQLIEAVGRYVAIMSNDSNIGLTRVIISEFLRDQTASKKAFVRSELSNKPFINLIDRAIQDGKLRKVDPEYAVHQLSALVKAFLFWPKILSGMPQPKKGEVKKIISDAVAMFLSHYRIENDL